MKALVLPILVPLSTAAVLMLAPKRPVPQRWISLIGSVLLLASTIVVFRQVNTAGIQVLQISAWPAPFGITIVADLLAAVLVVAVGVVGAVITVVAFAGVDPQREAFGYHPLIHILLMGVAGAFLTGDLFNLYVCFEVMLVASFVLMALNRTRAQMEAAFKYVTLNLIASSIFLTALGLLYGATGTLNMAELARVWPTIAHAGGRHRARGPVPDRVQHQGRVVPVVLLAPRVVSHAAGADRRCLRRPPHQGRHLCVDSHVHAAVPQRAGAALHASPRHVGGDHADRAGGRSDRTRFPARPLVQPRRSHRVYDCESQSAHTRSAGGRHLLPPSPYRRHHEPVSGEWRAAAIAAHDGYVGAWWHVP